jgi:hypothetical protein
MHIPSFVVAHMHFHGDETHIHALVAVVHVSAAHNMGANSFLRLHIFMIFCNIHHSLVVACWNYHCNG